MTDALAHLVIRAVGQDDKSDWASLWSAYLSFYEFSVAPEVYDTTFARLLSDDPHEFHGLLALLDGKPVGLVHYLFHRHCWRVENVCYLQDLYAIPAVRGTGIGRALIEAVYARADENGTPGVYWLTQEFNTTARQLYDRVAGLTPFVMYRRPTE